MYLIPQQGVNKSEIMTSSMETVSSDLLPNDHGTNSIPDKIKFEVFKKKLQLRVRSSASIVESTEKIFSTIVKVYLD